MSEVHFLGVLLKGPWLFWEKKRVNTPDSGRVHPLTVETRFLLPKSAHAGEQLWPLGYRLWAVSKGPFRFF